MTRDHNRLLLADGIEVDLTALSEQDRQHIRQFAAECYHYADTEPFDLMQALRASLIANKPNDRSEIDRRFAIAITDCERLIGFFNTYVIEYEPPVISQPGTQL